MFSIHFRDSVFKILWLNTTYILNKLELLVGYKPSFLQPNNWAHVNEFHQSMNRLGESEFRRNNSWSDHTYLRWPTSPLRVDTKKKVVFFMLLWMLMKMALAAFLSNYYLLDNCCFLNGLSLISLCSIRFPDMQEIFSRVQQFLAILLSSSV